jgi:hypothetical protein
MAMNGRQLARALGRARRPLARGMASGHDLDPAPSALQQEVRRLRMSP